MLSLQKSQPSTNLSTPFSQRMSNIHPMCVVATSMLHIGYSTCIHAQLLLIYSLTGSPGDLDDLCALSFCTFPITVTSLHSPGLTPDSKLPVGLIKAIPLVVSPSCSLVGNCHIGALACTVSEKRQHICSDQCTCVCDEEYVHTHRELYSPLCIKCSCIQPCRIGWFSLTLDPACIA